MIKLTPEEILWADSLVCDGSAIEETFKIALNFYNNRKSILNKEYRKFWKEMEKRHNLDMGKTHGIKSVMNEVCIYEIEEGETT
jgi:hypothetical protein